MNTTTDRNVLADPLQEQLDAAEHLARLMVGEDDERFILLFQSFVKARQSLGRQGHPPKASTPIPLSSRTRSA